MHSRVTTKEKHKIKSITNESLIDIKWNLKNNQLFQRMARKQLKRTKHVLSINHSKEKGSNAKHRESLPDPKKFYFSVQDRNTGMSREENSPGKGTQAPYVLMA